DWAVGHNVSLAALYILPMMVAATVLRPAETALFAPRTGAAFHLCRGRIFPVGPLRHRAGSQSGAGDPAPCEAAGGAGTPPRNRRDLSGAHLVLLLPNG